MELSLLTLKRQSLESLLFAKSFLRTEAFLLALGCVHVSTLLPILGCAHSSLSLSFRSSFHLVLLLLASDKASLETFLLVHCPTRVGSPMFVCSRGRMRPSPPAPRFMTVEAPTVSRACMCAGPFIAACGFARPKMLLILIDLFTPEISLPLHSAACADSLAPMMGLSCIRESLLALGSYYLGTFLLLKDRARADTAMLTFNYLYLETLLLLRLLS